MKEILKKILRSLGVFFGNKKNRRLTYLVVLTFFALGEFWLSGHIRRSFVFYAHRGGNPIVEGRMLYWSRDRETDIRRYVEEALLGPKSPGSLPLFPRGTSLHSFMYRDGVVYANLTESAALPLIEGSDVFLSLFTLNKGIRRNFSNIKNVRLFIGGNEAFFEEFRVVFSNSADNS